LATFALERAFALRRSRVIPRDFSDRFIDRLANGKLDRERALELARANESPVARVFQHALRYWGRPAAEIRVALDHDAAGEIADLKRNVRVLNGIATLAPLLGLLGTVIGMIESFDALSSRAAAGRSEALAHGISLALVATAFGLVIAAIAVVLYYFFLHRIDTLTRELDDKATRVIDLVSSDSGRPIADRRMGAADSLRPEARAYT
jgi:biopolymer transport protein ExbB